MAVFGAYLIAAGVLMIVAPPEALRHLRPEAPYEPIRLLGILTAVVGGYYMAAARAELESFFRFTVVGRLAAIAAMVALVICKASRPSLLAVAVPDLLGAVWTAMALRDRTDRRRP
jgi:drug/metabolite transporter (DMT)-like permease